LGTGPLLTRKGSPGPASNTVLTSSGLGSAHHRIGFVPGVCRRGRSRAGWPAPRCSRAGAGLVHRRRCEASVHGPLRPHRRPAQARLLSPSPLHYQPGTEIRIEGGSRIGPRATAGQNYGSSAAQVFCWFLSGVCSSCRRRLPGVRRRPCEDQAAPVGRCGSRGYVYVELRLGMPPDAYLGLYRLGTAVIEHPRRLGGTASRSGQRLELTVCPRRRRESHSDFEPA
jgi:hypothetical protein